MKHIQLLLAILCTLGLPGPLRAQTPHSKPFLVGIWYEGGVGAARQNVLPEDPAEAAKIYERDFKDIAAHHITTVVVPNTLPTHHKPLLDAAEKNGLKLIIELGLDGGLLGHTVRGTAPIDEPAIRAYAQEHLGPIKNHPALQRVQVLDEPPAGAMERYAKVAGILRAYNPATPPFCCVVGSDAVNAFAKATQPDVIAFDHYPIAAQTPVGDRAALRSFADMAARSVRTARAAGADCYAVIQCHAITGGLRFPAPAEIRNMTHAALATGNRGVFWFLYGTQWLDAAHTVRMSGLVDDKGEGDGRWEEVGRLARLVQQLSPTLSTLTPAEGEPTWNGDVATYRLIGDRGKQFFYVVNFDVTKQRTAKLRATSKDAVATVTSFPGEAVVDPDRDGQDVLWEAKLPAGGGVLFRLD